MKKHKCQKQCATVLLNACSSVNALRVAFDVIDMTHKMPHAICMGSRVRAGILHIPKPM